MNFAKTELNLAFLFEFDITYGENILGPACFCILNSPGLNWAFSMSYRDAPKKWFFQFFTIYNDNFTT